MPESCLERLIFTTPGEFPAGLCTLTKGHKEAHTDGHKTWANGREITQTPEEDLYGAIGNNMPEHCLRMRAASGRVNSNRKLVSFLYVLARNEMPVGTIESLWINHVMPDRGESMFTNGWLAQWAKDMADRLEGVSDDD